MLIFFRHYSITHVEFIVHCIFTEWISRKLNVIILIFDFINENNEEIMMFWMFVHEKRNTNESSTLKVSPSSVLFRIFIFYSYSCGCVATSISAIAPFKSFVVKTDFEQWTMQEKSYFKCPMNILRIPIITMSTDCVIVDYCTCWSTSSVIIMIMPLFCQNCYEI